MKVFLDTNIFCKNWFVSSANFSLLFYFLNNHKYDLLLSDLVVQETNNVRAREINEIKSEIKRLVNKGNKLNSKDLSFTVDGLGIESYGIEVILNDKVDWIHNIDYNNIPHNIVVERALKLTKPFTNQEKGYRDTLIWLSFLSYLAANNIEEEVAFITNNKQDFFETKGEKLSFNKHLLKDINDYNIKANIKPYLNIYDFVNENVDKISHSFGHYEILDKQEYFLITETEAFLNAMNNDDLSHLLETKVFSEKLTPVIYIESNIFEGLEDQEVIAVKRLPENSVYIESYYEMRLVDLIVTIDLIEYKQYADDIEEIKALYNIELEDDYAKLSFSLRTCIDGSFEYDTNEDIASNLSIGYIFNRRPRRES